MTKSNRNKKKRGCLIEALISCLEGLDNTCSGSPPQDDDSQHSKSSNPGQVLTAATSWSKSKTSKEHENKIKMQRSKQEPPSVVELPIKHVRPVEPSLTETTRMEQSEPRQMEHDLPPQDFDQPAQRRMEQDLPPQEFVQVAQRRIEQALPPQEIFQPAHRQIDQEGLLQKFDKPGYKRMEQDMQPRQEFVQPTRRRIEQERLPQEFVQPMQRMKQEQLQQEFVQPTHRGRMEQGLQSPQEYAQPVQRRMEQERLPQEFVEQAQRSMEQDLQSPKESVQPIQRRRMEQELPPLGTFQPTQRKLAQEKPPPQTFVQSVEKRVEKCPPPLGLVEPVSPVEEREMYVHETRMGEQYSLSRMEEQYASSGTGEQYGMPSLFSSSNSFCSSLPSTSSFRVIPGQTNDNIDSNINTNRAIPSFPMSYQPAPPKKKRFAAFHQLLKTKKAQQGIKRQKDKIEINHDIVQGNAAQTPPSFSNAPSLKKQESLHGSGPQTATSSTSNSMLSTSSMSSSYSPRLEDAQVQKKRNGVHNSRGKKSPSLIVTQVVVQKRGRAGMRSSSHHSRNRSRSRNQSAMRRIE